MAQAGSRLRLRSILEGASLVRDIQTHEPVLRIADPEMMGSLQPDACSMSNYAELNRRRKRLMKRRSYRAPALSRHGFICTPLIVAQIQ